MNRGTYNSNNQYVPVKPAFKLKDKAGFSAPSNIQLPSLYKLKSIDYNGISMYPVDSADPQANLNPLFNIDQYLLLLDNGRCMYFSVASDKELLLEDLDPTNEYYSLQYYFPLVSNRFIVENFVPADGAGRYVYFIYELSDDHERVEVVGENTRWEENWSEMYGNTKTKRIYDRKEIPGVFSYEIDW